jgi:glycosyltransferase involved in cell wall biosynthesis
MKLDIIIHGNSNHTGFGIHCRNLLKALTIAKKKVAFVPIQPMTHQLVDTDCIKDTLDNQRYITGNEPALMVYHASHMIKFCGQPRMGYAIFETDVIPEHEIALYKTLDQVLVPSEWGRNVLVANGINYKENGFPEQLDSIKVVPEGYDHTCFNVTQVPEEIIHRARQRGYWSFLHVGKYEERKSTNTLLEAFKIAVEQTGVPAILNAKIENPFDVDANKNISFALTGDKDIRLWSGQQVTDAEMARFYHESDFGLYASKGEAWGLPILESIACGLPTITSNWTGMSEYLKGYPDGLIVGTGNQAKADDGKFFRGDRGCWYVPDKEDLIERIKFVLRDAEQIYRHLRVSCVDAVKGYTWENAVKELNL